MGSAREKLEGDRLALCVSEILQDRLFFVTFRNRTHANTTDLHYFSTDGELVYRSYYSDFGPLNLAAIAKYIHKVNYKLKSPALNNKAIVHHTSTNEKKRVNAALLMAVYAIVRVGMGPREAFDTLSSYTNPYLSFQDASMGESQYRVRLIDCLFAIHEAVKYGFVRFDDFNVDEFEKLENIKFGDISWVVPKTLLAFSGPVDDPTEASGCMPEWYVEYFRQNGVSTVVRLNNKVYNSKAFTTAGIAHYDMYFPDGTAPSYDIVEKFMEVAENAPEAVAVHCKAGLGRTGCLIGAYLVKHYKMTALEAIAWMRMCRPGCVVGGQQTWLQDLEPSLWSMGESYRARYHGGSDRFTRHKYGIYSFCDRPSERSADRHHLPESEDPDIEVAESGKNDLETQGDKLNLMKRKAQGAGRKRKVPRPKLLK